MAIDTSIFKPAKNRWQDIFRHLKKHGFSVYSPGIKVGEAIENYIVVKLDGSSSKADYSTDEDYYSIMCYVPQDQYSSLDTFVQDVKKAMKELEPMIIPYGIQTPSYYDEAIKCHMVSIEYKNYKKWL